jgi:hypothetical protein
LSSIVRRLSYSQCSAERPRCRQCLRRNIPCEYRDLSKQAVYQRYEDIHNQQSAYEELFDKLINLPENDSLDLLRRIRAGNDARHSPTRSLHLQTDPDTSEVNIHATHHNVLKRKNEQLEQRSRNMTSLYGLLQHASEHGANELFRYIRQGMSPDNVPTFTGELLSRRSPSPNQTNRNILPATGTSTEFQLVALHPNAYPALIPLDVASIDLRLLGISPFTTFHSKPDSPSRRSKDDFVSEYGQQLLLTTSSAGNGGDLATSTERGLSSEYIDARLNHIHIRRWTDVAVTDDLAARAISLYLVNNTSWLTFFDLDLFLEDLAHGETQFCSRLLVNAVLSWACVSLI